MTTETLPPGELDEDLTGDEFYTADDPPDMPEDGETPGSPPDEPGAAGPPPDSPEAPYGWTKDRKDGWRPKKRPGRPRVPASAADIAAGPPVDRTPDRPPGKPAKPKPPDPTMPAGGVIARGVNRLYRRAGKIVRAMDADIGTAIIECTRPDDDGEDLTVGEAWENLCKTNPRIRAFVLRCLSGGAWGDLVMAHAPIAMAILMKPAIASRIPFRRLVESWLDHDEDTKPDDLQVSDVDDMAATARAQAEKMARRMGVKVPAGVMAEAERQARAMQQQDTPAPPGAPPGLRRAQPKRQSRAKRTAGK